MGYWNYRVVNDNGFFTIREIYYDDNNIIEALSTNPMYPSGTMDVSVRADLDLMYKALDKPILTLDEIDKQIKNK